MGRHLAVLLAVAVAASALGGCLGFGDDGDPASDSGLGETQRKAKVSTETGGIEGIVTDAAIQAVANVSVEIEELGDSTTTASDGSFAFSEVTPGTYTLTFEKESFISAERDVDVVANDVTTLELVIAHEPTLQPYMQQFEWTGFMECGAGGGADSGQGPYGFVSYNACSGFDQTNSRTTFYYEIQPNAWQIVTEASWDPANPSSDRFWLISEAQGFNNAWNVAFVNERSSSPAIERINRTDLAHISYNFQAICNGEMDMDGDSNHFPGGNDAYCNHNPVEKGEKLYVSVSPQASEQAGTTAPGSDEQSGAGAAVQQEFTVYSTVFYNAPACEDYSITEDNRCEQLDGPPEDDPYTRIMGNFTVNNSSGNGSA